MNEKMFKIIAIILGWHFSPSPMLEKDYNIRNFWVFDKNGIIFHAYSYANACNGWTNLDTWEDFNSDIIAWKEIKKPFCNYIIEKVFFKLMHSGVNL